MRNYTFGIVTLGICCAIVAFSQSSHQPVGDSYAQLQAIVGRQVEAVNQTNASSNSVSAIHKEAQTLLSTLPLSDEKKKQFLLDHLRTELLETQRRDSLIRLLLGEIAKQKVQPDELQPFAQYLRRPHSGDIDDALFACLVTIEARGTPIFFTSLPTWGPILKYNLRSAGDRRSILTEHMLEAAEREHWKPVGTRIWPEWSGAEEQEIAIATLERQRNLLAQQYLERKLQK